VQLEVDVGRPTLVVAGIDGPELGDAVLVLVISAASPAAVRRLDPVVASEHAGTGGAFAVGDPRESCDCSTEARSSDASIRRSRSRRGKQQI
jgi:hypothetical protein